LHVSAKDKATGKEQIRSASKRSLASRKRTSSAWYKTPKLTKRKTKSGSEEVTTRNEADSLAFRAEKALTDYKEKIPADVAADIQAKIDAVKTALKGTDSGAREGGDSTS
jgi:molecular chaperone DnaK